MLSFATTEEQTTLASTPKDSSTSLFHNWALKMKELSDKLEQRTMEDLKQRQEKSRSNSPNIGAVYDRLEVLALTAKFEEPIPQNQVSVMNYFVPIQSK